MLKMMGAALLVGGAAVLGCSAAAELSRRVRALRELLRALERMEREITFRLTPMDELLERLAQGTEEPVSRFFALCREKLSRLGEEPLSTLWRESLEEEPMGLSSRSLETLAGLGLVLGRYDSVGQGEGIAQARLQLEEDLCRAEEARVQRGKLYRVLGVSLGTVVALALL